MNTIPHPAWCAQNYRCTATRTDGEHLSRPLTFPMNGAGVSTVVSLVQRPLDPSPMVEVRLRVRLRSCDQAVQVAQIRRLLLGFDAVVGTVTG